VVTTLDRVLAPFPGHRDVQWGLAVAFVGLGIVAAWGLVIASLAGSFPGAVRAVFTPFHDRFTRGRAVWLGAVCVGALVIWSAWAFEIASAAGLMG
jgi:hypothetical protein